jgi:hypothetical protein
MPSVLLETKYWGVGVTFARGKKLKKELKKKGIM